MKRNSFIALVIFLCVTAGVLLGNLLARRANMQNNVTSFSALIRQIGIGQGSRVDELLSIINQMYIEDVDINQLTEDAMIFIMSELDPHSVFIPAADLASVESELQGSFSGIGVQFNIQNDTIMIISVIRGGPSEKVGLLAGDRIVEVDDSVFVGQEINNERVLRTLRGERGTEVKLGIKRLGTSEILHYTVTRGDIPIHSVDIAYMIEPNVGFIRLSTFSATTYNELLTALASLRNQGAQRLIIDLRENTGGLLDQVILVVNEFLPRGQMIVYSEGRARPRFSARADGSGSFIRQPLILLIDEFSASASEIFAGAVQDNDRGLIIGRRSFGKGLVQQQIGLSDGSAIRLTVAQYFTPTGRSIQKPFEMGNSEEYEMDIWNRYLHGEFHHQDSIHLADSLIFHTPSGRAVFGGGVMIPDVFVPRDTIAHMPYLNRVFGFIHQFAFQYTDRNRETLNKFTTWQALERHLNSQNLLNDFVKFAEERGVKPNWDEINRSKQFIERRLKVLITRNILGDEGFFPLLHRDDPTVIRALEEFRTNEMFR